MSSILEFLNENSGALSALFSGVVTVATIVYAWLTAKLVFETRRMRQAQTEPQVQITYATSDIQVSFLNIVVKNVGLGSAHRLKFEVTPISTVEATKRHTDALKALSFIRNGLGYLGPSQELATFWVSLMEGDGSQLDTVIQVRCTYENVLGTAYSSEYQLDVSELKGFSRLGGSPLHKIADSLEKVERTLSRVVSGSNRVRVDTFSKLDRDRESEELDRYLKRESATSMTSDTVKPVASSTNGNTQPP